MKEGDLRLHLQTQTRRTIAALDILAIQSEDGGRGNLAELLKTNPAGVLFDALDHADLRKIGGLVWEMKLPFAIGSSGFTSGIASYLSDSDKSETYRSQTPVEAAQIVVMSGSGSPVSERQIRWALANGFAGIRLPVSALIKPSESDGARWAVLTEALGHLHRGQNLVLYSALGPSDCDATDARDELGKQMGLLLHEILLQSRVKRALIAGGDTSSHAGQQLGIYALTMISDLAPGAPLCRAHSEDEGLTGLELVMKGGQVGREDFFASVLQGHL
jgi:uncharacterized protein YgbK (DUF1537 family)